MPVIAAPSGDRARKVRLDVVVPVWNEEQALEILFERLGRVFSAEVRDKNGLLGVRYLMVDDGSHDASAAIIAEKIRRGAPATLLRLSRNLGHRARVRRDGPVSADLAAGRGPKRTPRDDLEMVAAGGRASTSVTGSRAEPGEPPSGRVCLYARGGPLGDRSTWTGAIMPHDGRVGT